MIQVRVFPFGALKDWLGAAAATVELPEGATVANLLDQLARERPAGTLRGIAVAVNAEYAAYGQMLLEGDEVGLLPPVSGGCGEVEEVAPALAVSASDPRDPGVDVALTRQPIAAGKLIAAAKRGEDGAVVVFDGIVRNHSLGRRTLYLDYEAYEEMALKQMRELAAQTRARFAVRHVTLIHRLGRLEIGETSVLIVVASAHRAPAFDACRSIIDTLKKTVPIWKRESFQDGAVWAPGEPFPAALAVGAGHET